METPNLDGSFNYSGKKFFYFFFLLFLVLGAIKFVVFDRQTEQKQALLSAGWKIKLVNKLSFEAPFDLAEDAVDQSMLPLEIRKQVEKMGKYSGEMNGLNLVIYYLSYREGVAIDLKGAADGAIKSFALSLKDNNPNYSNRPKTINGLPVIVGDYEFKMESGLLKAKTLFLKDNQTLYSIIVAYPAAGFRHETAERILGSIQLL